MSSKWPGGFINKTAPTVTGPVDGEGGSAPGIWTLDEVAEYEAKGLWPKKVIARQVWTWGQGTYGQLGNGTNTTRLSSPVQVGSLTTWKDISSAKSWKLILGGGKMYAFGRNDFGQLGVGNTTDYSSPVQIGALTTWSKISSGSWHGLAIKTDGTLWTWGDGGSGQLGDGSTAKRSSPVQVGALTTWASIAGYSAHSLAVKTDGTLWAWGSNGQGNLGDGTTTNRSSPVQIGSLTNWSEVFKGYGGFSVAIKTDGTLWMWGVNSAGQLGLDDTTSYSSPVQVGSLTTWSSASTGSSHTLAVKTSGTLWSWGSGSNGKLGHNSATSYSSPVQVGSLTNWLAASGGYKFTIAVKTNGQLWGFGANDFLQVGQDNQYDKYSSPVQIGALTSWLKATAGYYGSGALKAP